MLGERAKISQAKVTASSRAWFDPGLTPTAGVASIERLNAGYRRDRCIGKVLYLCLFAALFYAVELPFKPRLTLTALMIMWRVRELARAT
ncbi:MAG TPA: hypothetical protein VMV15_08015 [Candidatus Binataceae bacterium]|nr:hypothetical protein [Candidatus Binataceae bacterium]